MQVGKLPVELDVCGRRALVVGADQVMVSKIERLLGAGALVTVHVLDDMVEHIEQLERRGAIVTRRGEPPIDAIVFVSPAHELGARGHYPAAREAGRMFCCVDRPELSTFVNPAAITVSGIGVRFVSGGVSPGLVRQLRIGIERALSAPGVEALVDRLRRLRQRTPRDQRARVMREAIRGVSLEAKLVLPAALEDVADAGKLPPEQGT